MTCAGTPTGAVLTYDNEGRLTAWQNAPSNPTSTEAMAYDGEGQRVALHVNGGTPACCRPRCCLCARGGDTEG